MEYDIFAENTLGKLIDRVNRATKEGWIPQGGASSWSTRGWVIQAMIKPDNNEQKTEI